MLALGTGTTARMQSDWHICACFTLHFLLPSCVTSYISFATLLDSSKNGCRLKNGLFKADKQRYGFSPRGVESNAMADILGILKSAGRVKGDELMNKYKDLGDLGDWTADDIDLRRTIDMARKTAENYATRGFRDFEKEVKIIEAHVDGAYDMYRKSIKKYRSEKDQESTVKSSKSRKEKSDDIMLECTKKFAEPIPGLELFQNRHLQDIKASYAYVKNPRFSFQVAFRSLCLLKADASPGGLVPIVRIFDEAKKVTASYMRALEWVEDDVLHSDRKD